MHRLLNRLSTAAAAIASVAALALTACGSSPAATPTPMPPATATPIADLAVFLSQVDDRVIEIRGIPKPPAVPYRFVNADEMRAFLAESFDDPETLAELEIAQAAYRLLGLIPQDMALLDAYMELLNSQVLGVYDSEKEEFVVLQRGEGFGALEELTYAHEYVHRLQDAQFGLDELTGEIENDDSALAMTALIEGDASAVQNVYGLQHMSMAQMLALAAEALQAQREAGDAPHVLERGLEFPYIDGLAFVNRLTRDGGFAAVDAAFADPPVSSEQVMHPEKYLQREDPVTVALPESLFPEGWTVTDENTLGEFFLKVWLESLGVSAGNASAPAAGWGGDSYILAEDGAGGHALAVMVTWDDPARDAAEFYAAMTGALEAADGFERVDIGPDVGIRVYNGPGGVLAVGNLATAAHGQVTVITVAPDQAMAMALLLGAVR